MENKEIKIVIICPCDIEYQVCKEILKLENERKLAGRLVAERREKNREVRAVKAGVGKINCE